MIDTENDRDSTFEVLSLLTVNTQIDCLSVSPETGDLLVEFKRDGKPSGLSVTEATHILCKTKEGVVMIVPIRAVKSVSNIAYKNGSIVDGEQGRKMISVKIADLLNYKPEET